MLDPVAVLNARLIVRCGRDNDRAGMEVVRKVLAGLGPTTTLRETALVWHPGEPGRRKTVIGTVA